MRRDGYTQLARLVTGMCRILNMQGVMFQATPPLYRDTTLDTDTKVLASWSLAQAHLPPTGRTESKLAEKVEQRYGKIVIILCNLCMYVCTV